MKRRAVQLKPGDLVRYHGVYQEVASVAARILVRFHDDNDNQSVLLDPISLIEIAEPLTIQVTVSELNEILDKVTGMQAQLAVSEAQGFLNTLIIRAKQQAKQVEIQEMVKRVDN